MCCAVTGSGVVSYCTADADSCVTGGLVSIDVTVAFEVLIEGTLAIHALVCNMTSSVSVSGYVEASGVCVTYAGANVADHLGHLDRWLVPAEVPECSVNSVMKVVAEGVLTCTYVLSTDSIKVDTACCGSESGADPVEMALRH